MKKIPVIPEYYTNLPDSTNLSSKEVTMMFGYEHSESLGYAYVRGIIPKPDEILTQIKGGRRHKVRVWKLGTIRKWWTSS